MSTEAELAGNYVTSGGQSDASFVASRLAEMQDEVAEQRAEATGHEATRQHVETTGSDDVDLGTLEVDGETVPILRPLNEELGAGHLARLQTIESNGMDEGGAKSFVALLEALAAVTPEEFDEDWWFDLSDKQIGSAFRQASVQSQAGNGR